jgi:hypothetical protein
MVAPYGIVDIVMIASEQKLLALYAMEDEKNPHLSTITTFVTRCSTNALLDDVGRSSNKYKACRVDARLLVPNPGTARVLPVRVCLFLRATLLRKEGAGGYIGGFTCPSSSSLPP